MEAQIEKVLRRRVLTSARKEVAAIFMERHGHNPVCEVERLLDTITVVNIDVYVQHSRMVAGNEPIRME